MLDTQEVFFIFVFKVYVGSGAELNKCSSRIKYIRIPATLILVRAFSPLKCEQFKFLCRHGEKPRPSNEFL